MKPDLIWRYRFLGTVFSIIGLLIMGQMVRFQFDRDQAQNRGNYTKVVIELIIQRVV